MQKRVHGALPSKAATTELYRKFLLVTVQSPRWASPGLWKIATKPYVLSVLLLDLLLEKITWNHTKWGTTDSSFQCYTIHYFIACCWDVMIPNMKSCIENLSKFAMLWSKKAFLSSDRKKNCMKTRTYLNRDLTIILPSTTAGKVQNRDAMTGWHC